MKYGYTLNDRYVYRKTLGKGANGSVYYAYDQKLEKYWAIKVCSSLSPNELEALKKVDYYAFPRIVDIHQQDDKCFMVMDYIEGIPLSEFCKTHSFNEKQLIRWGIKIANALSYLHNMSPSMIYMDCKPDNILVTPSGDIRIVDFGSIYLCDNAKNPISGTRFYAPQEIKHPSAFSTIGVSTDIYCLGMTLYKLATNSITEYRTQDGTLCLHMRNRRISDSLCTIIQKCTSPQPTKRYQSMEDVSSALKFSLSSDNQKFFWLQKTSKKIILLFLRLLFSFFAILSAYKYVSDYYVPYILLSALLLCLLANFPSDRKILTLETKTDLFKRAISNEAIMNSQKKKPE